PHNISSSFPLTDPAHPAIYTLSLHDALPISDSPNTRSLHKFPADARISANPANPPSNKATKRRGEVARSTSVWSVRKSEVGRFEDRKSTRLNSSHDQISYAVFCLKKKRKKTK